jgi:uncharacterized protein
MLIVISPAKSLDFETPANTEETTQPALLSHSQQLIDALTPLAPQDLSALMDISDKLATLNYDRYRQWQFPSPSSIGDNAKQALLAFTGDVYAGLDAQSFNSDDFTFAQQHLRILSGLYGVLRPLDLIQAYRLEMGTRLHTSRGHNLYQFWGDIITANINKQLAETNSTQLINLASNEYFKSINTHALTAEVITPVFKDWKSGKYKIISFFAKQARGLMSAYIIINKLSDAQDIKQFTTGGYRYHQELSTENQWLFCRRQQ